MPSQSQFVPSVVLAAMLCLATGLPAAAAEEAEGIAFFETRIRPLLVTHCDRCHAAGPKPPKGGLLLDSRPGILAGGDSGPAVVPGKPQESLLMAALRHEGPEMPPSGRLPEQAVADFETWIRMGVPDPRTGEPQPSARPAGDVEAGRDFWGFRPIARPPPPAPRDPAGPPGA
ncbi:MAG: c-type cytochrome domain-containing protein, partial [Planctomycetia bacterium]